MRGIHTWWGTLGLVVRSERSVVRMAACGVTAPGGIEMRAPFGARPRAVTVDGTRGVLVNDGRAVVIRAPAVIEFSY